MFFLCQRFWHAAGRRKLSADKRWTRRWRYRSPTAGTRPQLRPRRGIRL